MNDYVKAQFVRRGDQLVTAANASGNVLEVEREVKEVFTGDAEGITEIRCVDGTVYSYPSDAQVEIVGPDR
ncbi:MAG: hypothetical protein JSS68_15115 [Actinobacteria bacterium]|nr:hypothetical protein [Actinomycetota bacterium]